MILAMVKIDAHQHFWKYSAAAYGWIDESMSVLQRDFLPSDLRTILRENDFDGSIAVQACQTLEETRWLLELAAQNDFILGVVGWVDLCSESVGEELRQVAADKKLVGIRHVLQGEADDRYMLRPEFRRGIAKLAEFGLVYDLLLYPRHLPVAVELVKEFPAQAFVLDHIAKPSIAAGTLEPWARDIRTLAKFPNVSCKLSGLVTEARWHAWKQEDFVPYLDVVLEAFGPSRLMIGSDWPVCTLSADHAAAMRIVQNYIAGRLSEKEQAEIVGQNCVRIYRRS
jgi:L-fuconolactonase